MGLKVDGISPLKPNPLIYSRPDGRSWTGIAVLIILSYRYHLLITELEIECLIVLFWRGFNIASDRLSVSREA
jgi:hypothetical protein